MTEKSQKPFNLWKELKRRNVFRVVAMYAGAAYVVIELVNNVAEPLHLPDWTATVVILLLIIGFPIVGILSWIFDFTPEGLKKTKYAIEEIEKEDEIKAVKRKIKVSDAIIAILIVAVCILLYPKVFKKNNIVSLRDKDGRITLAIMPFENLTGDSTLDYWQRGIPEILINDLGASKELLVASSLTMTEVNQSMGVSYSASLLPNIAKETAKKLKASIFINGKYQKSRGTLRIMVNIVNTDDGTIIWTNRIDGNPMSDYLELSDSISKIIKNHLEIESIKEKTDYEYREAFAESAEAYRFYIEGVESLLNEDYELTKQHLLKALEIDSTFVMASFYMAWAHLYGSGQNFDNIRKWINKAYINREKLPSNYQYWLGVWYSMFVSKDREEILRYCNLLSQSNIKSRLIIFDIGLTYTNFALYTEAIQEFEKIMEINAEWGENWKNAIFYKGSSSIRGHNAYHECGKHERENEIYEIGLSLFPNDVDIISRQAICALSRGDSVVANNYIKKIVTLLNESNKSEVEITRHLGSIYESAKFFDKAEKKYKRALEIDPNNLWISYFLIQMLIVNDINIVGAMNMNQKILDQHPDDIRFMKLKGLGFLKQGRFEEALILLKKWEDVYAFEEETDQFILEAERAVANMYSEH